MALKTFDMLDTSGFETSKKLEDSANIAQVDVKPYQKKEQSFM
jgi:hypothetical protein